MTADTPAPDLSKFEELVAECIRRAPRGQRPALLLTLAGHAPGWKAQVAPGLQGRIIRRRGAGPTAETVVRLYADAAQAWLKRRRGG